MTRVAEELRQPAQLWTLATAEATLALSQGRFAEAAERIERAAAVGDRAMAWSAAATRRLQLFMLRREQGRLGGFEREIRDNAHEFLTAHPRSRSGSGLRQYTAHGSGGRPPPRAHARGPPGWHVDEEWLASICLLAETCAILDDAESADPLYELLVPYGSQNAVALPELALDSVSRPLGILASLHRRFEDAARHFQDALRMNERMGARPSVAHTQEDHARMLLRRDAHGDRDHAEELLSRACATYRELGMQDAAEKAAALARTGTHA